MTDTTEKSRVLTLVFTDLAGSTALKTERGDQAVGDLISRHRAHVTNLAERAGGRIIDWAGDGCFLAFETPSAGVLFALRLQQAHTNESDLPGVRVGVHMGEVTDRDQADGSVRIEGLAVDLAARIESLGTAGQVLMSSEVFNSARQRLHGDALDTPIAWRAHGPYELKGFDDPLEICEAGFEGVSPLEAPTGSEKAHRAVTPAEEDTLGWRPAVGLAIPLRDNWILEGQLGEGGFGEVWLAKHKKTKAKRVFKFCFEADRVRGLKREVVLFRLLRESLGDREDIAQILDWEFEKPPYFLEAEYTEGGDLKDWAKEQGGIAAVPLDTRLDLVAQTAVALGAAHSVGVLHKDVKPANILVRNSAETGAPRTRLTDFGIGRITDAQALIDRGITAAGMTDTLIGGTSSSGSGTRLYMAPEVIEGKPPTTLSDIYSLGVVLYQAAIGDLTRGVATGWERDIEDELLREDIALCVDGSPDRRITSAAEIAERIRTLGERHAKVEEERRVREEAEHAAEIAEKAKRRRKQFTVATSLGIALTVIIALAALRENRRADEQSSMRAEAESARTQEARSREEAESARVLAESATAEARAAQERAEYEQYVSSIQVASVRMDSGEAITARSALLKSRPDSRGWEWGYLVNEAWPELGGGNASIKSPGATSAETWTGSTPSVVHELPSAAGAVIRSEFTRDGRFVTTANFDGTGRIWDAESGDLISEIGERGGFPVYIALYSPKYRRLVTNDDGGTLWDTATGRKIAQLTTLEMNNQPTGELSRDETLFALTYDDNVVRVFETASGRLVSELAGHSLLVYVTDFSDDNKRLFTSGRDGTVREWEVQTGDEIRAISAPFSSATLVSPNLREATTFGDEAWNLWDLETGEISQSLPYPGSAAYTINYSPDGSLVMVGTVSDNTIQFWNVDSGEEIANFAFDMGALNQGYFNPDGNRFVTSSMDGVARVWAPLEQRSGGRANVLGHSGLVALLAYSPDGRHMASASYDNSVKVWDVESGTLLSTLTGHSAAVDSVAFSPDGRHVVSRAYDGAHRVWEWETGREIAAFEPDAETMLQLLERNGGAFSGPTLATFVNRRLTFSPDGSRYVARTESGVGIVDANSGAVVASLEGAAAATGLLSISFSPDGTTIALSGDALGLHLFNADNGALIRSLEGHTNLATATNFSSDGRRLASASLDGTAKIWDVASGEDLLTLEGHQGFLFGARFDEAGNRVVTASADNTSKLFDAKTGEVLVTFSGHSTFVMGAEFSPDETRILTYARDNTAKVWDLEGHELVTLTGEKQITHATWSPDGSQIATAWEDGNVRTFNAVSWEELSAIGDEEVPFEERLQQWRATLAN